MKASETDCLAEMTVPNSIIEKLKTQYRIKVRLLTTSKSNFNKLFSQTPNKSEICTEAFVTLLATHSICWHKQLTSQAAHCCYQESSNQKVLYKATATSFTEEYLGTLLNLWVYLCEGFSLINMTKNENNFT